ncbi:ribonuclease P protein component [Marinomonas balearica]|uniref:Ribonuclease P protein component n=1 Tax=Marinomonas balearica TaxID=491947 RepID=A0A4R6M7N4_9GAMM|nr:ribonuclease P protein component [Marinomonas balearica]TDO97421.1 ribonuclease P protein component [Marinomonas balearica]
MAEYCFPRHNRLLNAGDYQSVFNNTSFKVFAGEFLILAHKQSGTHARLGLIVAKKNEKRAVGRNRIKRVVRESFRHHKMGLNDLDIVFLARKGIKEIDNQELHKRLEKAWAQLAKKAVKAKKSSKAVLSPEK